MFQYPTQKGTIVQIIQTDIIFKQPESNLKESLEIKQNQQNEHYLLRKK